MTDFLSVKPLRTFAVGKELKTKRSDAFDTEAGEARLLEAQKLVEIVGQAKAPEVAETEVVETEVPVIAMEQPKRGKKIKSDAPTDAAPEVPAGDNAED